MRQMEDRAAQDLREKLKLVIDPELMVNIVDLGLVYRIAYFEESRRIELDISLTTRACPLGALIVADVQHIAEEANPGWRVDVQIVWDPPWTPELMSEAAREALGRV